MKRPRAKLDHNPLLEKQIKRKRVRLFEDDPNIRVHKDWHHDQIRTYRHIIDEERSELNKIEERFCHSYCSHYEPSRAVIEAGYRPGRSTTFVKELLKQPRIRNEIKRIEAERLARITYDGDLAARLNWLRAYHPRLPTIFNSFIPCCRYCHGTNHEYQRTHAEFEEQYNKYMKSKKPAPFDEMGGSNFDPTLPPDPRCPQCLGRGVPEEQKIILKDLNHLSPEAQTLIAGIKLKDGKVEQIIFHDAAAALDHLKPLNQRWHELQNGARPINIDDMTLEQMEQIIEEGRQLGFLTDDE